MLDTNAHYVFLFVFSKQHMQGQNTIKCYKLTINLLYPDWQCDGFLWAVADVSDRDLSGGGA